MAWGGTKTWNIGDVLTAGDMNTYVRDNMKELWREVDYVEKADGDVSITATSSATAQTIVAGTSRAYTAEPIFIHCFSPTIFGGGGFVRLVLYDGATELGRMGAGEDALDGEHNVFYRVTPSAATHQYIFKAYVSSGTGTVRANSGASGQYMPAFIRVEQRGG